MYCILMAFKSFLHILDMCGLVAAAVPVSAAPVP